MVGTFILSSSSSSIYAQTLKSSPADKSERPSSSDALGSRAASPPRNPRFIQPQSSTLLAQIPRDIPRNNLPRILPPVTPPPPALPQDLPPALPPPEELLQPPGQAPLQPEVPPREVPQTVEVQQFEVKGSTVFDADDLAALAWQATQSNLEISELLASYCLSESTESESTESESTESGSAEAATSPPASTSQPAPAAPSTAPDLSAAAPDPAVEPPAEQESAEQGSTEQASADRCCPRKIATTDVEYPQQPVALTFDQLLRARSAITQLYINCGYITSGAILPPQTPADQNNTVTLQVVEGSLEEINVGGTRRLNPNYVRRRLAIATTPPLRQQDLLQALQLLQLNPLIDRISAELQAGTRPSTNILAVTVTEADSLRTELRLDNNRAPSVGSFERGVSLAEANLLGFGDGLSVSYTNTDGSNEINAGYEFPFNPRNGTIAFNYQYTHSNVIEPPFDILGISSDSFYYDLTVRQPLYQTPTTEFALGLTLSREESQTRLSFDDIGPFPLSPGADDQGRTRVTAIRFTQDWFKRTPRQVLAARSQFSLGLDFLDSTINEIAPDSRFFAWRGQGQWVRQLDPNGFLILARTDMQFTGDPLVPLEQFGLGGQSSVRGYRQDALLTDNGVLASLELQYPILKVRQLGGRLYIVPFIDAGTGWNVSSPDPNPRTIVGTGIGLLWRQDNNNLSAQLFYGVPLVSIENAGDRTWQENGIYFSVVYSPF